MTQAKIEPGNPNISLGKKDKHPKRETTEERNHDLLPELGLKNPVKPKTRDTRTTPLDGGIDLGK